MTIMLLTSSALPAVKDDLGKIIDEGERLDIFSGIIMASYDGNTVFKESVGLSNKNINTPNLTNTKYNIASLGKLFTSVMILQLADENKIDLDGKVSELIKGIDDKITIRMLLQHTSGYGDYLNDPEFIEHTENYRETSELTELILKSPLLFEPGERFSYSNSGFVLLGKFIETVTGKKYSENLKERILDPLDMKNSEYTYSNIPDPNKATGYIKQLNGSFVDNGGFSHTPSPAGGMYSTADDLCKFGNSLLLDNKVLTDQNKILMFSDFEKNNNAASVTLKELFAEPDGGNAYAGGAPGISSLLMFFPAQKYVVVVLSNYDQAAENLARNISGVILRNELVLPKISASTFIYSQINEKGLSYVKDNFEKLLSENDYKIRNDMFLNMLGYEFLNNEMYDESIFIFTKNTEMFPDMPNCYDSLGEAYLKKGDIENAIANYNKVLQLDPENENAKRMLGKMN
ncbi:MAG: serine hydrolase [Ignavibacteria bacterium]